MIERIKTISFGVLIAAVVVTFALLLTDVDFYGLLSAYVFIVLWSLDKVFLWYIDEDFGIANQLKIQKGAPKVVRLLGLFFVCFTLYVGATGLIEHVST